MPIKKRLPWQVAEPGTESPEAPIGADSTRREPGGSKPPPSEDVLGPSSAFAGEPVGVPSPQAAQGAANVAAPSLNLPNIDSISPAVLAVGGGAVAAGLGAAAYLAASKARPFSYICIAHVLLWHSSLASVVSPSAVWGDVLSTTLLVLNCLATCRSLRLVLLIQPMACNSCKRLFRR